MVKHTQKIRRQPPTNCLSVFDHFVRLALKGLTSLSSLGLFKSGLSGFLLHGTNTTMKLDSY